MKKKIITLYIIIAVIILSLAILYIFFVVNKFNKSNVVFEFYAQDLQPPKENGQGYNPTGIKNRVSYYVGLDKYKNLYVIGGNESQWLASLWQTPLESEGKIKGIEYEDARYRIHNYYLDISDEDIYEKTIKINSMKLDEYILNPTYIFQKKLSDEEYEEIISLMEDVEKTWVRDNACEFISLGPEDKYFHCFRFNNKIYTFSSFVNTDYLDLGFELGFYYEYWGETAVNNIIKVRGIIDKYIDSSLDPKQFNYSEWKKYYYISDDKNLTRHFSKEYSIPDELYNY